MLKSFVVLISLITLTYSVSGQKWEGVGTGISSPDSSGVYALCEYKGKLYVGGNFISAGNKIAYNIASWDGSKWDTVGAGTNAAVRALCVYKGELYAAGDFNKVGGLRAQGIAKWNGKKWSNAGDGLYIKAGSGIAGSTAKIRALCVYHDELYACGGFKWAGTEYANSIAKWDSVKWSALGKINKKYGELGEPLGGVSPWVTSLVVYHDKLYIGGWLYWLGELKMNFGEWDGKNFNALPGTRVCRDTIPPRLPLGAYKNKLLVYAGCDFFIKREKKAGIFAWNDTIWSYITSGVLDDSAWIYGYFTGSIVSSNSLYVYGSFSKVGGIPANNITRWDGANWYALDKGLFSDKRESRLLPSDPVVAAMVEYKGFLYAGGGSPGQALRPSVILHDGN
jgi:trimeric autotransporter adhesin